MAQKNLLQIAQAVAAELNLPQPTVVLTSTDENILKLLAFIRAICDDVLAEHDWQLFNQRYSFVTTDGVDNYAFPADIERFIDGTFYDSTSQWPIKGSITPTQWESRLISNSSAPLKAFRIQKDRIYINPTPGPTPYTFVFEYVSNYYVRDVSTGLTKPDFTEDSDVCLFDHRIIIYGVKMKWRASIGQDTTDAAVDYLRALEHSKGSDEPAERLSLLGGTGYRMLSTDNYPDGDWIV